MKQLVLSFLFIVATFITFSQEEDTPKRPSKDEETGHFRRENIYIGGGVGLGFSSNTFGNNFNFGVTPEVGYSLTNWLDMGVSINLNYYSYNYSDGLGGITKQRSFNYGGGVYLRAYPLQEFFVQVLPEYNFISTKLTNTSNYLVGVGYGRRIVGQSGFYTALMIDLGQDPSSPYRQISIDANSSSTFAIPVIRAGFTVYLRPKNQK